MKPKFKIYSTNGKNIITHHSEVQKHLEESDWFNFLSNSRKGNIVNCFQKVPSGSPYMHNVLVNRRWLVEACKIYAAHNNIDPSIPYFGLISKGKISHLIDTFKRQELLSEDINEELFRSGFRTTWENALSILNEKTKASMAHHNVMSTKVTS